jgi:hypothetical protein
MAGLIKKLTHSKNYRANEYFTNLIWKGIEVACLEDGKKLTIISAYNSYKLKVLTSVTVKGMASWVLRLCSSERDFLLITGRYNPEENTLQHLKKLHKEPLNKKVGG